MPPDPWRRIRISSGRFQKKNFCPQCKHLLDAATLAQSDDTDFDGDVTGHATLCGYCGAGLIFADPYGKLRRAQPQELDDLRKNPLFRSMQKQYAAQFVSKNGKVG